MAENQVTSMDWRAHLPPGTIRCPDFKGWTAVSKPMTGAFANSRVLERNVGAFWGHPSANDGLKSAGIPESYMLCCPVSGARALFYVWQNMLSYDQGTLRVHLLLNRASRWADIDSYIPYLGRVDIKTKENLKLEVRVPEWVKPTEVKCLVDGNTPDLTFDGRYTQVGSVGKGATVRINFPIFERTDKVSIAGEEYTLVLRGNDVVSIDPRGKICPLYAGRARYRTGKPQFKQYLASFRPKITAGGERT